MANHALISSRDGSSLEPFWSVAIAAANVGEGLTESKNPRNFFSPLAGRVYAQRAESATSVARLAASQPALVSPLKASAG